MTLRKTHKTWHKAKETAEKLKIKLNEQFSDNKLYQLFCDSIYKPDPEAEERRRKQKEEEEADTLAFNTGGLASKPKPKPKKMRSGGLASKN